jgi:parvulin-like peptidyl-prolyl isomerase
LRRTILFIAAAAMAVAAGCGEKDNSGLVIARVDTREITVGDFETVSATIDEKYLPGTDDLEGRKLLLKHMINKEIMGLKALSMGYEKEQWFIDLWENYRGPFLIAQLMDQMVAKKVVITEEDIDYYYEQMHYEYSLSQIVVASEDEISAIRERAIAGEDFAELARQYSIAVGADQGGFVGANPIGRMHWWVEEELFDMESGDISQPLNTTTGWALLKVHQKRKVEPTEDRDYAAKRIKAIREKKGMQELKAGIEKDIGLQFFSEAVNIAYDALPDDVPIEDIISYKVTRDNAPRINIPEQHKDMLICQYSDGSFTLGDFEELYYKMGLPERPRREYGREYIVQTMHKIVFDRVLPSYAEQQAHILEIPEVKKNYEAKKEMFLVHHLYNEHIKSEVVVTDRDIQTYYTENLDLLVKTEMRDYSVLVVSNPKDATAAFHEAAEGKNFRKLIMKYAPDDTQLENDGRTGLHTKGGVPDFDDVAFTLDGPGAISDPFQTARGWAVIKLEEVEAERLPTLDEARTMIKQTLQDIKYEEKLNEKLDKWREDYTIEIDESALAKAELKRTRL